MQDLLKGQAVRGQDYFDSIIETSFQLWSFQYLFIGGKKSENLNQGNRVEERQLSSCDVSENQNQQKQAGPKDVLSTDPGEIDLVSVSNQPPKLTYHGLIPVAGRLVCRMLAVASPQTCSHLFLFFSRLPFPYMEKLNTYSSKNNHLKGIS